MTPEPKALPAHRMMMAYGEPIHEPVPEAEEYSDEEENKGPHASSDPSSLDASSSRAAAASPIHMDEPFREPMPSLISQWQSPLAASNHECWLDAVPRLLGSLGSSPKKAA